MIEQNYKGFLLASHPKRQDQFFNRSVVLVVDHEPNGAIGLQINKSYENDLTFETVMNNVGLPCSIDHPLYIGGPEHTNRIHVVHSLDWFSPTTIKINNKIGVSNDVSVLAAISKNEGPEFFRAVAGFTRWIAGHLEGEVLGEHPWNISHTWNFIPATVEHVFAEDTVDQWHNVTVDAGKFQIATWF